MFFLSLMEKQITADEASPYWAKPTTASNVKLREAADGLVIA
jgi:hypothetical protein